LRYPTEISPYEHVVPFTLRTVIDYEPLIWCLVFHFSLFPRDRQSRDSRIVSLWLCFTVFHISPFSSSLGLRLGRYINLLLSKTKAVLELFVPSPQCWSLYVFCIKNIVLYVMYNPTY